VLVLRRKSKAVPAIVAEAMSKTISDCRILDAIDIVAAAGSFTVVTGPAGSGKTTLVRALAGKMPASGTVRLCGQPIDMAAHTRNIVGFWPHESHEPEPATDCLRQLTVRAVTCGASLELAEQRAAALANRLGLGALAGVPVARYCGSMRRRLSLALALAADPSVIVFDNPAEGLDFGTRQALWRTLADYAASGSAVVVTAARPQDVPTQASNVIVLRAGRIAQAAAPADFMAAAQGTDILSITPVASSDAAKVGEMLAWIGLGEITVEPSGAVSVRVDDGFDGLARVAFRLKSAGLAVASVTMRRATLADAIRASRLEGGR
jgi:lipooligosaccharide transport system ATP-binding protein